MLQRIVLFSVVIAVFHELTSVKGESTVLATTRNELLAGHVITVDLVTLFCYIHLASLLACHAVTETEHFFSFDVLVMT